MRFIYISPHLDDVVYSCGGHLWQQRMDGHQVEVWTLFAGDPPGTLTPFAKELHARWKTGADAVQQRRTEDRTACERLGAGFRHFPYPDCIYRRIPATGEPVIHVNEDLFRPVTEGELPLADEIATELLNSISEPSLLLVPLGVGGHVDHRLARLSAEISRLPLGYYADFPYSRDANLRLASAPPVNFQQVRYSLDPAAVEHWTHAAAAYASQLSSFWNSEGQMKDDIEAYARTLAGSSILLPIAYSQTQ